MNLQLHISGLVIRGDQLQWLSLVRSSTYYVLRSPGRSLILKEEQ